MLISTEEMMCLAYLRGDKAAARALADILLNEMQETKLEIPPVTKLTCDVSKIRAVVIFPLIGPQGQEIEVDDDINETITRWVRNGGANGLSLSIRGAIDFRLYELP